MSTDEPLRAELVRKAVKDWTSALVDLGGRNNLLHYRDLKLGTLDLTDADAGAVGSLLSGAPVRISSLFQDPEQFEQMARRARSIHKKARENSEERGLDTVSLGCGLATWENQRGAWEPSAPVLLQSASLLPVTVTRDDFWLAMTGELQVNPTLLHALRTWFGQDFDQSTLLDRVDGAIDEQWELREAYKWIAEQGAGIPGFRVADRIVLANFAYAKLEMVQDLERSLEELVSHDMIAALAGDDEARATIRAHGPGPDAVPGPDQIPLADEFLVMDADASQNYAINAVLRSQHLIIKGPPGTGKSQTISNLIASLAARGRKVLFVAEKRAAIEAVTKRLAQQGLGDLVLDLHGGVSRQAFAKSLGKALSGIRSAPPTHNATEFAAVETRREQLNAHVQAMHEPRMPWGLTVYDMRAELTGLGDAHSPVRLPRRYVTALDSGTFDTVRSLLEQYIDLGGLKAADPASPWANSPIATVEEAQQAHDLIGEILGSSLPRVQEFLERAERTAGAPSPPSVAAAEPLVGLWSDITRLENDCTPEIYALDLSAERQFLAPAERGSFTRLWASLTSGTYRAARTRVHAVMVGTAAGKVNDDALIRALAAAQDIARRWADLGGQGVPRAPANFVDGVNWYEQLRGEFAALDVLAGHPDLAELPTAESQHALELLADDRATLAKMPELHRLRSALEEHGIGPLLTDLAGRQASPKVAARSFRYVYLQSILDELSFIDPQVRDFSGETHQQAADEFAAGDRRHIRSTSARVRRAHAERAVEALDTYPRQAELVRHQAALKRRHLPVRDLVRQAADVIMVIKPCWAMSPLMVSQLLPAQSYFDVVIFDEASQVTPADAVTSIMRGNQLVVAGDDKQLPPTVFFSSPGLEDEDNDDPVHGYPGGEQEGPLIAGTTDFESILDALGSLLHFRMLTWHYRSRDERLIAFSNHHVYDRMLTTFPGTGGAHVLRHVLAQWTPGTSTNSPSTEVTTVVEQVLDHARERPGESLGVITMGITHNNRIDEAIRQRLRNDSGLANELGEFFAEDREERFFVKSIERVQGDERDAIILSVGYGKDANGKLPYRFGPLLTEGGERRLNVAVTRAKKRLTLVSSFSSHDMDPERSSARGVQLLRQYLQYAESSGANLGDQIRDPVPLNPFEADVRDTLTARGLRLTPQYGSSGYWIDFAVQHPDQPGRYILALECDGATYHSSPSARDRDRLRQEQLERIGWRFHRIWSSHWFSDKETAAAAAIAAYQEALANADRNPDEVGAGTLSGDRPVLADSTGPASLPQQPRNPALRPDIRYGLPITSYSDQELIQLAHWIRSDEILRTENELVGEMMRELGFQKRGSRITARLSEVAARTRT